MGEKLSGDEFAYARACVYKRERWINRDISTGSK